MILIYVSFESKEDGEKAANHLIDNHLAACVELYPVTNFYVWEGKKVIGSEFEAIIKTKEDYFEKVKEAIEKILPYDIPQIIAVNASNVNDSYSNWVKKSVK